MSGFRRRLTAIRERDIELPWISIANVNEAITMTQGDSAGISGPFVEAYDFFTHKRIPIGMEYYETPQLIVFYWNFFGKSKVYFDWKESYTNTRYPIWFHDNVNDTLRLSDYLYGVSPDFFYPVKDTITSVSEAFYNCIQLESVPDNLFRGCNKLNDFSYCFGDCSSLKRTPLVDGMELWERFPNAYAQYCFSGCLSLENYDEIPDGWK